MIVKDALHFVAQGVGVNRFAQEGRDARAQGNLLIGFAGFGGPQDAGQRRSLKAQGFKEVQAAAVVHVYVQQGQVHGGLPSEEAQGLGAAGRPEDFDPKRVEQLGGAAAQVPVVVRDQEAPVAAGGGYF